MTASAGRPRRQGNGPRREFRRGLLAITGLSSLAIAQPLYDLLRRTPEFFAVRQLLLTDVLTLAALLAAGPALAFSVPAAAARCWRPTWIRPAVAGPAGLLAGVIVLQAARELSAAAAVLLAAAAGAAVIRAYVRLPALLPAASILAIAAIAAPAILMLDRDVRRSLSIPDYQPTQHAVDAQAPIVLVVFDEWSVTSILDGDGRIDRQRLPNLARLADSATWYPGATAASNMTTHAVPAILTGSRPVRGQLPIARDHPANLFTLLARSHDLFAMEPVTSLCPPRLNRLEPHRPSFARRFGLLVSDLRFVWLSLTLPEPWSGRLPPLDQAWSGFGLGGPPPTGLPPGERQLARSHPHRRNDERVADFRRFIDSLEPPGERPSLHFAHVLLPHAPWEYLPSGRRYARSRTYGLEDGVWTTDRWTIRRQEKRYLMQVEFVDRLIGELIDRLESLGLFDRSLIAVTADHGSSFLPGRSHRLPDTDPSGGQLLDLVSVPLIVKAPHQEEARIDDRAVSLVELTPRLLELAGAAPDALARYPPASTEPLLFGEHAGLEIPVDRSSWRRERIAAQTALLGEANDPAAIGTLGDLHGRAVAELPLRNSEVRVRLDQPGAWDDVDEDARFVPAVVDATLVTPEDLTDRSVVVALNGVVADSVRPHIGGRGRNRISALLPDELLRPGRNQVDLFLVSDRDGVRELERLAPPDVLAYEADPRHSWQPERNATGAITVLLRRPAGNPDQTPERFRVAGHTSRLFGYLSATVLEQQTAAGAGPGSFRLNGWAFDGEGPGRRGTVVAMIGDHNAAAFAGPALRHNGFTLRFAAEREQVERLGIAAFAVGHGGEATRLRFRYQAIERDRRGREIIPVSDGRRLVVTATGDEYAGAIDRLAAVGKGTGISAWAADLERMDPPRQVVIYRDNDYLALLRRTREDRTEVAERYGAPGLLRSGFDGLVPGGPLPSVFPQRHRVFAVMESGAAVELPTQPLPDDVR